MLHELVNYPKQRAALLATGFAVVKLATDKSTGEEYACKIMALPAVNARATDSENTR